MEKTFELAADSKELLSFRENLKTLLASSALDEKSGGEVLVAVQEALTNVVRHAYGNAGGKILVDYKDDGEKVILSIRDFGKKFDLTKVPDPELPREQPGGLGIFLIKKLMDRVEYDGSSESGNLLHLVKLKSRIHKES